MTDGPKEGEQLLEFTYTNHRGVTERRRVHAVGVWFGTTEHHPEPTPLLRGFAMDRPEGDRLRDFDLRKILWDGELNGPAVTEVILDEEAPAEAWGDLRQLRADYAAVMERWKEYVRSVGNGSPGAGEQPEASPAPEWECVVCGYGLEEHLSVAMGAGDVPPSERFLKQLRKSEVAEPRRNPEGVAHAWRQHAILVVCATAANAVRVTRESRRAPEESRCLEYHRRLIAALHSRVTTELMADAIEEAMVADPLAGTLRPLGHEVDLTDAFVRSLVGEFAARMGLENEEDRTTVEMDELRDLAAIAVRGLGPRRETGGLDRWIAALETAQVERHRVVDGERRGEWRVRVAQAARKTFEHWVPDPASGLEQDLADGVAEVREEGEPVEASFKAAVDYVRGRYGAGPLDPDRVHELWAEDLGPVLSALAPAEAGEYGAGAGEWIGLAPENGSRALAPPWMAGFLVGRRMG